MPYVTAQPIIRPVLMSILEVPRPTICSTVITRTPDYTHIGVHPASYTPQVAQEIAVELEADTELGSWIHGFTPLAVDLRALRHDPIGYLRATQPHLLHIPCQASYIPPAMLTRWVA